MLEKSDLRIFVPGVGLFFTAFYITGAMLILKPWVTEPVASRTNLLPLLVTATVYSLFTAWVVKGTVEWCIEPREITKLGSIGLFALAAVAYGIVFYVSRGWPLPWWVG